MVCRRLKPLYPRVERSAAQPSVLPRVVIAHERAVVGLIMRQMWQHNVPLFLCDMKSSLSYTVMDPDSFKNNVWKLWKTADFSEQNMLNLLCSYKQLKPKSWIDRTLFDFVCIIFEHHLNNMKQYTKASELRSIVLKQRPTFQFLSCAGVPGKSAHKSD